MFTGIVEELGTIAAVQQLADSVRLTVRGTMVISDASPGDSIAVNGCCLTVAEADITDGSFTADVMRETLRLTNLGTLAPGSPVNLERAVRVDARLGGHVVSGHIDGTATVVAVEPSEHWTVMRLRLGPGLANYVVSKGSVAIDGVSLTIAEVFGDTITVSLIPTTLGSTTLGARTTGDHVNVEVDVLAKYVEHFVNVRLGGTT